MRRASCRRNYRILIFWNNIHDNNLYQAKSERVTTFKTYSYIHFVLYNFFAYLTRPIESFNARTEVDEWRAECLELTTSTRTAIRNTIVPTALPGNLELKTRRVAQGRADDRDLQGLERSYGLVHLQRYNLISIPSIRRTIYM